MPQNNDNPDNPAKATASNLSHLNAKIDKNLLKKMRVFCAQNDMKIQDFLADAIREKMLAAEKDGI
jgi:hypothetical protein